MKKLKYSVQWRDDAANASAEESATMADLRLFIGDRNVAFHLDEGSAIDRVTVPLYGIAEGLVHDWWRIFGGRDQQLSWIRYRDGYALPDVRMSFDGAVFEIWAEQRAYANPDVRFWSGPREIMSRETARDQLRLLIEETLERLSHRGVSRTSAALRWERVSASMADPDEAEYCEAAGALNVDPYDIDDAADAMIEKSSRLFEGEPLAEFLAGARAVDRSALIEWVGEVENRDPAECLAPALADAAHALAADSPATRDGPGWARGYRRARALRARLGLGLGTRFADFGELARAIGASDRFALAPPIAGVRLLRTVADDGVRLHLRSNGRTDVAKASQLFALARGVGDVICFPDSRRSAINDLRSAHRQALSRAFAAEFLAPVAEIESMIDDGYDLVGVAGDFGVATEVVERQLENAGRIEAACA